MRAVKPTFTSWTLSGGGLCWCGPLAMFITLFLSERRLCRRRSCNFFLCFLCVKHKNNFKRQRESSCNFQHVDDDNSITSLFLTALSPPLQDLWVTLKTAGLIAAGAVGTCRGGRMCGNSARSQQATEGWEKAWRRVKAFLSHTLSQKEISSALRREEILTQTPCQLHHGHLLTAHQVTLLHSPQGAQVALP